MPKRKDYISWDEYFMGVAILSSKRSKDPDTQVGVCIVDPNKVILSTGYNGFPIGISDDLFNWDREDRGEGSKYDLVVHAEINAILNASGKSLRGATLYTKLFPCLSCAKAIIQSGIKEVVYIRDDSHEYFKFELAKKLFDTSGVIYRKLDVKNSNLCIDYN